MSIEKAADEMATARSRAAERAERRRAHRLQVRHIERLVEQMEIRNLRRDRQVSDEMWLELSRLEDFLPVPAPASLWKARTTVHLHNALLDWEGDLLDLVAPQRRLYPDRNEQD